MKNTFVMAFAGLILMCCDGQGTNHQNEHTSENEMSEKKEHHDVPKEPASKRIDLSTKGVGVVQSVEISDTVDEALAKKGEALFGQTCVACHKINKRLTGPALRGVTDRRTPEWIMNMIMNPSKMTKKDALAKELLMEFNGAPMANLGVSEENARAILEYFRTQK